MALPRLAPPPPPRNGRTRRARFRAAVAAASPQCPNGQKRAGGAATGGSALASGAAQPARGKALRAPAPTPRLQRKPRDGGCHRNCIWAEGTRAGGGVAGAAVLLWTEHFLCHPPRPGGAPAHPRQAEWVEHPPSVTCMNPVCPKMPPSFPGAPGQALLKVHPGIVCGHLSLQPPRQRRSITLAWQSRAGIVQHFCAPRRPPHPSSGSEPLGPTLQFQSMGRGSECWLCTLGHPLRAFRMKEASKGG